MVVPSEQKTEDTGKAVRSKHGAGLCCPHRVSSRPDMTMGHYGVVMLKDERL